LTATVAAAPELAPAALATAALDAGAAAPLDAGATAAADAGAAAATAALLAAVVGVDAAFFELEQPAMSTATMLTPVLALIRVAFAVWLMLAPGRRGDGLDPHHGCQAASVQCTREKL
jgi:hypothetical protein